MLAPLDAVVSLIHPYVLLLPHPALAVVVVTVVARILLLPVSVRQARTQARLRALQPRLTELRNRFAADPARLAREVRGAYGSVGASPLGLLGTGLLQAPVFFVVYRLCTAPVVGGVPNELLSATLLGVPLSSRWVGVGLDSSGVFLVLVLVGLVVAWLSARLLRRTAAADVPAFVRWLPYGVVASVPFVPLAVAVYLVTSAAWSVGERAVFAWVGVG